MKVVRFIALAIAVSFSSCKVSQTPTANNAAEGKTLADGKLWAALWTQRAAEYKALCFQAFNIAKWRLDQALMKNYGKPLAIITDIDETILDNSPNTVKQSLLGKEFEQESWYKWTDKALADTVPGAAAFLKYAASKPVSVFYISNRDGREQDATLKNLKKFGLPNADAAHLLLKQGTSAKEARRQEVLKNYEVIMLIGDNLSDFSSVFDKQEEPNRTSAASQLSGSFGNRFIVLPNIQYGDWEGALFKYNYQLNPAEKEQIIKKSLKGE